MVLTKFLSNLHPRLCCASRTGWVPPSSSWILELLCPFSLNFPAPLQLQVLGSSWEIPMVPLWTTMVLAVCLCSLVLDDLSGVSCWKTLPCQSLVQISCAPIIYWPMLQVPPSLTSQPLNLYLPFHLTNPTAVQIYTQLFFLPLRSSVISYPIIQMWFPPRVSLMQIQNIQSVTTFLPCLANRCR